MNNIFKNFNIALGQTQIELLFRVGIILAVLLYAIHFFDKALAIGLFFLILLSGATIFLLYGFALRDKNIYIVFLMGSLVHLGVVLFLSWTGFKPFGGGADFTLYNNTAIQIAQRFSHGNFSLQGLYTDHFFPILIGVLYMFVLPDMIVGQFFTIWLAAVSILLTYLIVLEIGGTKKIAFLVGIIISFYPSYLYFGSVLLKDTVVIPFALAGILLMLKMIKNFSWLKFLLFFIILTCLINLRFYIGYALMFTFIVCWPLLSGLIFKKKITYWLIIIFLLGFSPQIIGNGYYASNSFKKLLNQERITYYREIVYSNNPPTTIQLVTPELPPPPPVIPQPPPPQPPPPQQTPSKQELNGSGSTFKLETGLDKGILQFSKNSLQSFLYSLLGPFPWQLKHQRQIMGLVETIPWYVLIVVSLCGCIRFIKKRRMLGFLKFHKFSLPLLLFSVLAIGALSLFINNYGIIARIRIPMFICLISVMFISFNGDIEKIHEKISYYWWGWLHRLPFIKNSFRAEQ